MTWNYRVIHSLAPSGTDPSKDLEPEYSIHEVYYDKAGMPRLMSVNAIAPSGTDLAELKRDIKKYIKALKEPVLEDKDFPRGR